VIPFDWFDRSRTVPLDGYVHPDFLDVASTLERQLRAYPGGAGVCVFHAGECVVDLWGGVRDAAGRPWLRDTMSPSFSTTKGVASTLLHIMVDQGRLDYDDPVARYWPEFAQAGKAGITVRHVMAHQSGLYHIRQMVDHAERMLDWAYMIGAIERAAPIHVPGARTGYHGLTYGYLVGELVQRVTGLSFSQAVHDFIAEPLGLDGCYIGAPSDQLGRAAQLIWPTRGVFAFGQLGWLRWSRREIGDVIEGPATLLRNALSVAGVDVDVNSLLNALAPRGISAFDFGAEDTLRAAIPAANGLFTARSLARLYATLAAGGTFDGVRLLSPETVARATQLQSSTGALAVIPFDMRWRLGYHGIFTTQGVPRNAYGHFGFGGSGAWADPSRQLAFALIVNSGMGSPFGDFRTARLSGAALGCANARRTRGYVGGVASGSIRRAASGPLPGAAQRT
jgi:CubicO group peptidase (beta-lactamase class C family)